MRALIAIALSVAAILAGHTSAAAADLPRGYSTRYSDIGRRAAPLVIYQYEPGVTVRAYWLAPWRNRRYFPTTGELPEIGRLEDFSERGEAPQPAETFERSWSTSSAFVRERPRVLDDEFDPDEQRPLK